MEYFGLKLQTLRKKASMSQEDLANLIGVSRQAISKWERSEALPDLYNAKKIAEVFAITLDELMDIEIKSIEKEKEHNNKLALAFLTVIAVLAIVLLLGVTLYFRISDVWTYTFIVFSLSISFGIIYVYGVYNLYIGRLTKKYKSFVLTLNFTLLIAYLIMLTSVGNVPATIIILLIILFLIIVLGIIGGFLYNPEYSVDKSEEYSNNTRIFKKLMTIFSIAIGLISIGIIGDAILTHPVERINEVSYSMNLKDQEDNYVDSHISLYDFDEGTLFIASDGNLPNPNEITRIEILFDGVTFHDSDNVDYLGFIEEIVEHITYTFDYPFEGALELSGNQEISIILYTNYESFTLESNGVVRREEYETVVVPIWVRE